MASNRQEKWFDRNLLSNDGAINHVKSVLYNNGIDNYEFGTFNDQNVLYIRYESYCYILIMAVDKYSIDILQRRFDNNAIRKIGNYNGDTCWVEAIRWLTKYETKG